MEFFLPIVFVIISFIYSSIGLGGGSSYTALMAITGVSYKLIPTTSLALNLFVTFIGMLNFWKSGHGRLDLIGPFLITSIPMAYFAGSLDLREEVFQIILTASLILIAIRIYIYDNLTIIYQLSVFKRWTVIVFLGLGLGFISGAVGIGGGIYLVPLIIMFGLGSPKEASAAGAMFIWANSLAGFIARYNMNTFDANFIFPLIIAVIVGGFLGSYFGSMRYTAKTMEKIMGAVIILAVVLMLRNML